MMQLVRVPNGSHQAPPPVVLEPQEKKGTPITPLVSVNPLNTAPEPTYAQRINSSAVPVEPTSPPRITVASGPLMLCTVTGLVRATLFAVVSCPACEPV